MTPVARIIDKFGGIRPLARALNRPVSTVQSWKDRGAVPHRRQAELLEYARAHGIELTPAEFFDFPAPGSAA